MWLARPLRVLHCCSGCLTHAPPRPRHNIAQTGTVSNICEDFLARDHEAGSQRDSSQRGALAHLGAVANPKNAQNRRHVETLERMAQAFREEIDQWDSVSDRYLNEISRAHVPKRRRSSVGSLASSRWSSSTPVSELEREEHNSEEVAFRLQDTLASMPEDVLANAVRVKEFLERVKKQLHAFDAETRLVVAKFEESVFKGYGDVYQPASLIRQFAKGGSS